MHPKRMNDLLAERAARESKPIGVCDLHADMTGLRPIMAASAGRRCKYCRELATMIVDENTPPTEIYDD